MALGKRVQPGMRIAVGVGSRGIACIGEVASTVVTELQALGAEPFLVPAMGSHGGGAAEGQREVLEGYGLGPDTLGVPILSNMDAVQIGEIADGPLAGMPVYFDVNAAQADGVIVINRIKPHTAFRNRWESGLFKMLAVGLGKRQGANTIHNWGIVDAMPASARVVIEKMPIIGGVAIVENGHHGPAHIEAVPASELEAREPALLELAWQHMPGIPIEPLDLLVLREIGKDISGTGMDLNAVGMWRRKGGPVDPEFRVLAALDLTAQSHGNAIGVGYCDLIPQRLRDKIDDGPTYTNCLTSGNFNGAKIPITLPTDRDVIRAGLPPIQPEAARLVIVRNTLDLETFWVSEALLAEIEANPTLTQIGTLRALEFDANGSLGLS